MSGQREVVVAADPAQLAQRAAAIFSQQAREAIADHGYFRVALSGGNTPRGLYAQLVSGAGGAEIDWTRVQVFFSDERFVPPDSAESNYHMAHETLLAHVPIPERFVHRVATVDIPPQQAAAQYEEGIRRVFAAGLGDVPHFDLILLGLGPDGHTASLFPDTEALGVVDHLVAANFVPKLDAWRITFTYPLLDSAHLVLFLVEGQEKAGVVRRVLDGDTALPAARVQPRAGRLLWLLDSAAASELPAEGVTTAGGR